MATLAEIKQKAKEFALKKNYKKAIKLYETVIEKKPNLGKDAKFLNEIGELYQSDNNPEKAVFYFKKAIEFYITDYYYPQAIALCKKVLRIKTEDYETYKTLGELYAKTVNIGEAIQSYKKYIKYVKNRKLHKEVYESYKSLIKLIPTRNEFKYELIDYYLENGEEKLARDEIDDFKRFLRDREDEKELKTIIERYGKMFPDLKEEGEKVEEGAGDLADLLTSAIEKIDEKKKKKKAIVEDIINETEEEAVVKNIREENKEEKGKKKTNETETKVSRKEEVEKPKEVKKPKGKKKKEEFVIERGEAGYAYEEEEGKAETETKGEQVAVPEEKEEKTENIEIPVAEEPHPSPEVKKTANKEENIEAETEEETVGLSKEEKAKIVEEGKKEIEEKIKKGKIEKETELNPDLMQETTENLSFEEINPSLNSDIEDVLGNEYIREEGTVAVSAWDEYMDLANLSESLGDTDQAYHYYMEAADGYYDEGKYDKSKLAYERSYKLNPENLKPLKQLAGIFVKLGDNDKAAKVYQQLADNLDKHNASDEAAKMREKAARLSSGAVSIKPKTKKEVKVEKPEEKKEKAKAKETKEEEYVDLSSMLSEDLEKEAPAKKGLQEKIDLSSILNETEEGREENVDTDVGGISEVIDQQIGKEDYTAHYDLGISYKEMGMYDMAINEFRIAMKGEKEQLKVLDMLAVCHIEMGKFTTAENIFKKALSLKGRTNEEYAGISFNLAQLYEQMGEFRKALDYYKKAKKLGGEFPGIEKRIKNISDNLKSESGNKIKKNKISYI
ncbi:MAG: tetratricopeptide repeat protein [Proteobacteria bacterium]|nr:tetratricopeptide repeat protein [Pseudomonadota bacterium]